MRHSLLVADVERWSELNSYEGLVRGELDGLTVQGHLIVTAERHWAQVVPGARVDVDAWFETSKPPTTLRAGTAPALRHLDGPDYEVVGRLVAVDGDELTVQCVRAVTVDLDLPVGTDDPDLRLGTTIAVVGELRLDLATD